MAVDGEAGEGGYKPWWAIDKQAWREVFSIYYKIKSVNQDLEPLPAWTIADVAEFAEEDPVHGPQVQNLQKAATAAAVAAAVGGTASLAFILRQSRNVPAAAVGLVGGAAVSWALAEEIANYSLGLFKFEGMDANLKFLEWRRRKAQQLGSNH
ncbi:hypothetical protein CBR_g29511 [Chara braunii]|uniref:Uncharacterized protein n=1 Tax=Chara braunii TaxID=69332 RepID=A0A388LB07_CHABU|nr:hypothetical protein CBR_g29511 [Chara braunii]|eukprot:GBG79363.1 hypothetical protein CBR_g29511 [Chara braunii]